MPRKYIKKNIKKNYSNNTLTLAVEAIERGCSIREASITYHVPYTTLNSHVNNELLYDQAGRPTKFSTEEERYLEEAALALQVIIVSVIFFSILSFSNIELGCSSIDSRISRYF